MRQYDLDPIDLVIDNLPAEARKANFMFYQADKPEALPRKDPSSGMNIDTHVPAPSEVTKSPIRRDTAGDLVSLPSSSSTAPTIHIDSAAMTQKSTMEVPIDVLERHEFSGDDKLEVV